MALTEPLMLLDTNIVLYLLGSRLAEPLVSGRYFVSVITEIELLWKNYRLRLPDAIIVATAKSLDTILFTNDLGLTNLTEINTQSVRIL